MSERTLKNLATAFDRTYTLDEILELSDLTTEEVIFFLLRQGLLDPELPHEILQASEL